MAEDTSLILPDHRLLYKPLLDTQHGGCEVLLWEPLEASASEVPVVMYSPILPIAWYVADYRMIHGGGGACGGAESVPYNQIRWFQAHRIAVASVAYRLWPHAFIDDMLDDCLDAVRYLQSNVNLDLEKRGSTLRIDGKGMGGSGWSSGGHLLCCLMDRMMRIKDQDAEALHSIKVVWPTYSLILRRLSQLQELLDRISNGGCKTSITPFEPTLQGWEVEVEVQRKAQQGLDMKVERSQSDQARQDDHEARLLWLNYVLKAKVLPAVLYNTPLPTADWDPAWSPVNVMLRDWPPIIIGHASQDVLVTREETEALFNRAKELGLEARMIKWEGMPHGAAESGPGVDWPLDRRERWWEQMVEGMEFVRAKLVDE